MSRRTAKLRLVLETGRVWQWPELRARTIALDGAVRGPRIDADRARYSFDHHGDCLRLVTRATCEQVFDALLLGLDPDGYKVLVNDLDADTVLSVWLLRHAPRWQQAEGRDAVRRLVASVGALDAHGPALPGPEPDLAWTMRDRIVGTEKDPVSQVWGAGDGMEGALTRMLKRMDAWWEQGLPLQPRTEPALRPPVVHDQGGWVLVVGRWRSQTAGTAALYADGHTRLILASRRDHPDGGHTERWRYTVARRSDLVDRFPVPALIEALNQAERAAREGETLSSAWGGGSSIAGSPRDGSVLQPEQVAAVVQGVLDG